MKYLLLVALALTCLCCKPAWTQDTETPNVTSCVNISIDLKTWAIPPQIVPNLPVCADLRNTTQCCSSQYIRDRQAAAAQAFRDGLRNDLIDRFADVYELYNAIRSYLENDFVTGFFDTLGPFTFLRNKGNVLQRLETRLKNNLEFNPSGAALASGSGENEFTPTNNNGGGGGFQDSDFLEDVLEGIENATITDFGGAGNNKGQCIRRVVQEHIQTKRVEAIAEALEQVRKALATVNFVRGVVTNLTDDLAGYEPIPECVDGLVQLNTCGRCTARRGPFCRNLCGALARACYSPFNNALNKGLGRLRDVITRTINVVIEMIKEINANSGIVDYGNVKLQDRIRQECFGRQPIGRRQANHIPSLPGIVTSIFARLNDRGFKGHRGIPGLCRLLNVSSSSEMCWNGGDDGSDVPEFIGDTIEDQVNNPAIDIPMTVLTTAAQQIGDPISVAFDSPVFAEVAPNGVILPLPVSPEVGGGASSITATTLLIVAFMMLAGFVL